MTQEDRNGTRTRLHAALAAPSPSVRLRAALAVGSDPHPEDLEVLVERCAAEPDFFVRDMLTWALTRGEPGTVTARVQRELDSDVPQARSQALHTLSKIGDQRTAAAITTELLQDADPEVARTAWRAAVGLAGQDEGERAALAEVLGTQLGRGDQALQLSLSRALVALGADAEAVLEQARRHPDERVAAHALATEALMVDPDGEFEAAISEARRTVALLAAPSGQG